MNICITCGHGPYSHGLALIYLLQAFQEKEFNEKKSFVEEFPLFKTWQPRYKKQLAMSLRKERINFDEFVVKQGWPVDGICFLLR